MFEHLEVAYLDASAEQLVWQLDAPLQPALAERRVERPDRRLELRLLGASHQVVLRTAGGSSCSELVACRPGTPGRLPASVREERGGLRYRFTSTVETLAPVRLARRSRELVERLTSSEGALVGSFPGSPHAVTAIEATADGWRTWHVYPQSGQIVATTTWVSTT